MFYRKLFSQQQILPRRIMQVRSKSNKNACMTTMDDLPVPEGDWYEWNAKRNAKFNKIFISGILALAGTIGYIYNTQPFHFYGCVPDIEE